MRRSLKSRVAMNKLKKNPEVAVTVIGLILGAILLGLSGLAYLACGSIGFVIGITIVSTLIYVLFNFLLPVVGFVYPLTIFQSVVGALIVVVLRIILRKR